MKSLLIFISVVILSGCSSPKLTQLPLSETNTNNGAIVIFRNQPLAVLSPDTTVYINQKPVINMDSTGFAKLPVKAGTYKFTNVLMFGNHTEYSIFVEPNKEVYLAVSSGFVTEVKPEGYAKCKDVPQVLRETCMSGYLRLVK